MKNVTQKKIIRTINYNTRKGMFFEKFQNRNEAPKENFIYIDTITVPTLLCRKM